MVTRHKKEWKSKDHNGEKVSQEGKTSREYDSDKGIMRGNKNVGSMMVTRYTENKKVGSMMVTRKNANEQKSREYDSDKV